MSAARELSPCPAQDLPFPLFDTNGEAVGGKGGPTLDSRPDFDQDYLSASSFSNPSGEP